MSPDGMTGRLHRRGLEAFRLGRWDLALDLLKMALKNARAAGCRLYEAHVRASLGLVFERIGLPLEALAQFKLALYQSSRAAGRPRDRANPAGPAEARPTLEASGLTEEALTAAIGRNLERYRSLAVLGGSAATEPVSAPRHGLGPRRETAKRSGSSAGRSVFPGFDI